MSAADSRSWVLGSSPTQRQLIASLVYESEPGWVVRLEPPRRTVDQNRLLHALLTEAVEGGLATDNDHRLTVDEARTAFVTAWMADTGQGSDMVMFGKRPVQLRRSTTELTRAEFSGADRIHPVRVRASRHPLERDAPVSKRASNTIQDHDPRAARDPGQPLPQFHYWPWSMLPRGAHHRGQVRRRQGLHCLHCRPGAQARE